MPEKYRVLLTRGAEQDLDAIVSYIARTDGSLRAEHVLDQLLVVTGQLSTLPERGSVPRELMSLGIKDYRQVFFKPYRIIYRISGAQVIIFVIVDGRRNLQIILADRLFHP
jgi:toxin ParE1/3/4